MVTKMEKMCPASMCFEYNPFQHFVAGKSIMIILGANHNYSMLSDEEEEEPLDWLPMAPEIEDPEEPGWGQLEVSSHIIPVF